MQHFLLKIHAEVLFFQKCGGLVTGFLKHFMPNYDQYQTVDAAPDQVFVHLN